jgi:hypothetical protein
VTGNVRHIAIQTTELQTIIKLGLMALPRVGTADNKADHYTKLLPAGPFTQHTALLMGLCFIIAHHAPLIARRNQSIT